MENAPRILGNCTAFVVLNPLQFLRGRRVTILSSGIGVEVLTRHVSAKGFLGIGEQTVFIAGYGVYIIHTRRNRTMNTS